VTATAEVIRLGCGCCMTPTVHVASRPHLDEWKCVNCGQRRAWGTRLAFAATDDPGGMYTWAEGEEFVLALRRRPQAGLDL